MFFVKIFLYLQVFNPIPPECQGFFYFLRGIDEGIDQVHLYGIEDELGGPEAGD
jgi:hypothetical protein